MNSPNGRTSLTKREEEAILKQMLSHSQPKKASFAKKHQSKILGLFMLGLLQYLFIYAQKHTQNVNSVLGFTLIIAGFLFFLAFFLASNGNRFGLQIGLMSFLALLNTEYRLHLLDGNILTFIIVPVTLIGFGLIYIEWKGLIDRRNNRSSRKPWEEP